jgi:hypothetical protein
MTAAPETRQAWRCTHCGKLSNAASKPPGHWRNTDPQGRADHRERCGPFAPAVVAPDGAVIAAPTAAVSHGESDPDPALRYRQSTVRDYVTGCPRSVVLSSHLTTGTIGSSADLGSALHATGAEMRRTLRRHGEVQMSTEEAVCIMREVTGRGPWVIAPEDYMRLVEMTCNMAAETWNPSRFMAIEQRLWMDVVCPDGETRRFTGTPDLVIADPPDGIILLDDKSGLAKPQTPREAIPPGEAIRGAQYLSAGGFFQLVAYFALCAAEWPRVQRATLREKNWRWPLDPPREATIDRADLEHILPYIGMAMQQLDQGLREGEGSEFAQPRPGAHCATRCPVKRSCPVPVEQRGLGVLDSDEAADVEAKRWHVIRALDKEMRAALKTYHEESEPTYAPRVNDSLVVRWKDKANGAGRDFGAFAPEEPPTVTASDEDVLAPWLASLEAQQETGAA